MKVWIKVNTAAGVKRVGYVEGDTFYVVKKDRHIYIKYEGIGFNKELIDKFVRFGHVKKVVVSIESYSYILTPQEIAENSIVIEHSGEKQYILSLNYLKQKEAKRCFGTI